MTKIIFDKLCTCSELQGYGGMKEWWELRKRFYHEKNIARVNGDLEKAFNYEQASQIVIQDGKTKMKGCELHFTSKVIDQ